MHDWQTMTAHGAIFSALLWIAAALHRNGVKMNFDIHIWKNGKKEKKDSIGD